MDIDLNENNELQVQSYLRFAKLKRDQHVRETLAVISDFEKGRVVKGEMYNYDDVKELFEDMSEDVKRLVDKEIQHAYHTNALLVKILLFNAQLNGMDFEVDTNTLENEFLLNTIAASEAKALGRPASDFVRRKQHLGKIGSIMITDDGKAAKERDVAKGELAVTQENMHKLQAQTTSMMREKTALSNELNQLKDQLREKDRMLAAANSGQSEMVQKLQQDFQALSTAAAGAAGASTKQYDEMKQKLEETRAKLDTYRKKYAAAKDDIKHKEEVMKTMSGAADEHIMNSKQFRQMKKMMQDKSAEVVELKKRLNKYEPPSVPSADR